MSKMHSRVFQNIFLPNTAVSPSRFAGYSTLIRRSLRLFELKTRCKKPSLGFGSRYSRHPPCTSTCSRLTVVCTCSLRGASNGDINTSCDFLMFRLEVLWWGFAKVLEVGTMVSIRCCRLSRSTSAFEALQVSRENSQQKVKVWQELPCNAYTDWIGSAKGP